MRIRRAWRAIVAVVLITGAWRKPPGKVWLVLMVPVVAIGIVGYRFWARPRRDRDATSGPPH